MGNDQDSGQFGKSVVFGLLAWAVVGNIVAFSNQDSTSMSVSANIAIAWPIFLFITPPGWALLAWIWNFGSKQSETRSASPTSPPAGAAADEGTGAPTTSLVLKQPVNPIAMHPIGATSSIQSLSTFGSGTVVGAKALSDLFTSQGSSVGPQNRSRPGATFDSVMDEAIRRKIATDRQRGASRPSVQSWSTAPSPEDTEPRSGDWRPADKIVSQLERGISRAKLSPEQRIRALEFLSSDHPYKLLKNCQRGHPFTLENTYFQILDNGLIGRKCRVCRREREKNQS